MADNKKASPVAPAPAGAIPIYELNARNLDFYAKLFREHKWETRELSWTVFAHTLEAVASRIRSDCAASASSPVATAQVTCNSDSKPHKEIKGWCEEPKVVAPVAMGETAQLLFAIRSILSEMRTHAKVDHTIQGWAERFDFHLHEYEAAQPAGTPPTEWKRIQPDSLQRSPGDNLVDCFAVQSQSGTPEQVRELVAKWRLDANRHRKRIHPATESCDYCMTRLHNADELEAALAAAPRHRSSRVKEMGTMGDKPISIIVEGAEQVVIVMDALRKAGFHTAKPAPHASGAAPQPPVSQLIDHLLSFIEGCCKCSGCADNAKEIRKLLPALVPVAAAPLHQRGWDLLRQMRHTLHEEGLITDLEYAELVQIPGSVERAQWSG